MRTRHLVTKLSFLFLIITLMAGVANAATTAKPLKYRDTDNNITLYAPDNEKLAQVYELTDNLVPLFPEPMLPDLTNRLVNKWSKVSRTAQIDKNGYRMLYKYHIKELPSIADTTKTDHLKILKDEYFIEVEILHSNRPHAIDDTVDRISLLKLPYNIDGFATFTSLPVSRSYPFKPEFREYNTLYIVLDKYRYVQVRLKPSLNFAMPSTATGEAYPAIEGSQAIIQYLKQIDFKKVYQTLQTIEVPTEQPPPAPKSKDLKTY